MKEYRFKITNYGLGSQEEEGTMLEWMGEYLNKSRFDDLVRTMFFDNQYNNVQPGEMGICTLGLLYVNSQPAFAIHMKSRQDRVIPSMVFYDMSVIRAGDAKFCEIRRGVLAE